MRMYDLIAAGVAAARQRKRWTQEDAARAFRYHGLTSWRTSTVGSLEAGLRRPKLDEVLLMCAALDVTLEELIPDTEDLVELGDGAVLSPLAIRALLYVDVPIDNPGAFFRMRFPGDSATEDALSRAMAEVRQIEPLLAPIRELAPDLTQDDCNDALELPTDAERHAARRLSVHPSQIRLASRALWGRSFAGERDARIGDVDELEPRSLQARRGLVARAMLAELRTLLDRAAKLDDAE